MLFYAHSIWNEAVKSLRRNLIRTVLTILGLVVSHHDLNRGRKPRHQPRAWILPELRANRKLACSESI
jgi:hypothetical protein